jgi:pimeloyl-ACP methyl ester carboxylesterase
MALLAGLPAAAAAAPPKLSRISVTVRGSGPDVVLIPGLSASRGVWSSTVAAVPGYRYHLVQVAGFAGSPAGGNARGPVAASAAEEIATYIVANRLDRPAIVGHSMGGSIAMMLAARHPRLPGKVMVVDMIPAPARLFGTSAGALRPVAKLLGHEIVGADRLRRDLQATISRFGHADWLHSRSDAGVVGRSLEELLSTDLTPELPRISAPLTVVYACPEPLNLTRERIGRLYASSYARRPGTLLVPIERSGHTIMRDQPAPFRAALRAFLARP